MSIKPKNNEKPARFIKDLCEVIMDLDDELTALKKWKMSKEFSENIPITRTFN